jgi:catechol 2,3-dioxygenase-like lactoylglutathione lyase family enzyme
MLTDPDHDHDHGLRGAPLLFLFLETPDIARQRALLEQVLALPLIENQFHPPHSRHGLFKYDAGGLILALNLAAERRFRADESDALLSVIRTPWDDDALRDRFRAAGFAGPTAAHRFTDPDGHHYSFLHDPTAPGATVAELRLGALDIPRSLDYFGSTLGLELLHRTDHALLFATGTIDLALERARTAPDGRQPRRDAYLPVFHTPDIRAAFEALRRRGLAFRSEHPGFSQIGGTARFVDPSGHAFCLYEPSAESLTWGSGPKVRDLATTSAGRR